MGKYNCYYLSWFEIMTYRDTKYVVYGVGQWCGHLMDWRGCNFHHGRIPNSPTFITIQNAIDWLINEVKEGRIKDSMELSGHFYSDDLDSPCRQRIVSHLPGFSNDTIG